MNDIERAIDGLERIKIGLFNAKIDGEPIRPHLNTAIAALEKQIPKKPVFAGGRYNCQCGWDICRDKQPYCMMCGKAIDWEV